MAAGDSLSFWGAAAAQPTATNYATLDLRNGHAVLDFDDTAGESTDVVGVVPTAYSDSGNQSVVLTWAATSATSGTVRWTVEVERQQPASSFDLDSEGFATAQVVETAAPAAAGRTVQSTIDLGNLSASLLPHVGESFRLRITRDAAHANDTLTGDAELLTVELREA